MSAASACEFRRPSLLTWLVAAAVGGALVAATPAGAQILRQAPDPQQLQPPRRAPLTITPSLTVEEEYDDNILLNNDDRRWDFITRFTPGLSLEIERPLYRLTASYDFTADIYARNPARNHAFDRHRFLLDSLYRVDPQLTLTLTDTFSFNTNTNLIGAEGVATGRDRAWSNSLAGGAAWQATPRTALRGSASWTIQRFQRQDLHDSDVYRAEAAVERTLTPRLTGSLGYEIAYFDIQDEVTVTAHTPRLGVIYRFTETVTGSLSAGPSVEVPERGDIHITPAVTASLRQRTAWGTAGVDYTQAVGTAGGLGGTTVNQSAGLFVQLTTLTRGLVVEAGPRYTIVESHDDRIDVQSFSLPVTAIYRLAPWVAVVASYTFFRQRSDSRLTSPAGIALANDVDQNRVSVGLTFGYPIRFD
jgi:hypothetical protein